MNPSSLRNQQRCTFQAKSASTRSAPAAATHFGRRAILSGWSGLGSTRVGPSATALGTMFGDRLSGPLAAATERKLSSSYARHQHGSGLPAMDVAVRIRGVRQSSSTSPLGDYHHDPTP